MTQPTPYPTSTPTSGTMPRQVSLARLTTLLLAGWLVLRAVITVVASDAILDSYVESRVASRSDGEAFREFYRDGAPAFGAIAIISALLFGGLLLVAALAFARRARWAQVVATVMAVLSVLGGVVGLFQSGTPFWYTATGFINIVLGLAVLVTLYSGPARAWFGKRI